MAIIFMCSVGISIYQQEVNMSNFYVVSTIHNIKNTKLFKKDNGNFVELENN